MDKLFSYFDLTLANKIKCSNREKKEYSNFYNLIRNSNVSSSKIFGFPYTKNIQLDSKIKTISDYIFNNLIDLEKKNENCETILDF